MRWGNPREQVVEAAAELRKFGRLDWIFTFVTYLTFGYLLFNILEMPNAERLQPFDFMPVAVGVPVIFIGWGAVRLKETRSAAMQKLQAGAGLEIPADRSLEEFNRAWQAQIRWWARGFGGAIMVLCFLGFWFIIGSGLLEPGIDPELVVQGIFLGLVMTGGGYFVGWLLGGLIGYGRLFAVMERQGIAFSGSATEDSREAMGSVEEAYKYSFQVTGVLCLWFAAWWAAWQFGFDQYKDQYRSFYLILWGVSVFLLVTTAWLPALSLNGSLDRLYGGDSGRQAIEAQLATARDDLMALEARSPAVPDSDAAIRELTAFIGVQSAKLERSLFLNPRLLGAAVAANALLFVVPWYFGSG